MVQLVESFPPSERKKFLIVIAVSVEFNQVKNTASILFLMEM